MVYSGPPVSQGQVFKDRLVPVVGTTNVNIIECCARQVSLFQNVHTQTDTSEYSVSNNSTLERSGTKVSVSYVASINNCILEVSTLSKQPHAYHNQQI